MNPYEQLEALLTATAGTLSESLNLLGFLNGDIDAPIPERNLVVHLAAQFLAKGYEIYAEPALEVGRARIDLIASDETNTFAVEVKVIGSRDPTRFHEDSTRLRRYAPVSAPRSDKMDPVGFWKKSARWGVLVIGSFGGDEYSQIWESQVSDPGRFESFLGGYSRLRNARKESWRTLERNLRSWQGSTGYQRILDEEFWPESAPLDLLWAAFPIKSET